MIDIVRRQSRGSNSLVENFFLHRKRDPFFRRVRIGPQRACCRDRLISWGVSAAAYLLQGRVRVVEDGWPLYVFSYLLVQLQFIREREFAPVSHCLGED